MFVNKHIHIVFYILHRRVSGLPVQCAPTQTSCCHFPRLTQHTDLSPVFPGCGCGFLARNQRMQQMHTYSRQGNQTQNYLLG